MKVVWLVGLVFVVMGWMVIRAWWRRRKGLSCDWCTHFERIRDEDLCGDSLGLEPVPWMRTCGRFERRRNR